MKPPVGLPGHTVASVASERLSAPRAQPGQRQKEGRREEGMKGGQREERREERGRRGGRMEGDKAKVRDGALHCCPPAPGWKDTELNIHHHVKLKQCYLLPAALA